MLLLFNLKRAWFEFQPSAVKTAELADEARHILLRDIAESTASVARRLPIRYAQAMVIEIAERAAGGKAGS